MTVFIWISFFAHKDTETWGNSVLVQDPTACELKLKLTYFMPLFIPVNKLFFN